MARKEITYTVTDEGRDKGKIFCITEMPASKAESWAMRALLALLSRNAELPAGFENTGMAGMAEIGLKALMGLKWEDAEPLLEEMMECVEFVPNAATPLRKIPVSMPGVENIEEVTTRIKLRAEVWKLHTDFLQAAALSA